MKEQLRESFAYRHPLDRDELLDKINPGALFDYLECDIKVPEHINENFQNFPPLSKKTNVCRLDIGPLRQEYAENKELMSQLRRLFFSTIDLTNGPIITPLLLFYLDMGLVCSKTYRFVEYTPVKCTNSFVQPAVNVRHPKDENPNSKVVAETLKLLANSSYRCQFMDGSRHSITK